MIARKQEKRLLESVNRNPVTALIGPRQCGKSTLVRALVKQFPGSVYLDLQRPSDQRKLEDAEWFFSQHKDVLVCMDEVQHRPALFPVIRSLVDEDRRPGRFLITGSAAPHLLKQTSETLAGRVHMMELTPFTLDELSREASLIDYLWRGGFPLSWLAETDEASVAWREDFITTYLERDLAFFAGFAQKTMRSLWSMLAFEHGQVLNLSKLGGALGVSYNTIARYVDLLEDTFMVHQVSAFQGNTHKRLVRSPKVYLSDSGITAALLGIPDPGRIFGHPSLGALWEGVVLTQLLAQFPKLDVSYYRTAHGAEIDFVIRRGGKVFCVECKASVAPDVSKGFWQVIEDLKPDHTFIAAPVTEGYSKAPNVQVVPVSELIATLWQLSG